MWCVSSTTDKSLQNIALALEHCIWFVYHTAAEILCGELAWASKELSLVCKLYSDTQAIQ